MKKNIVSLLLVFLTWAIPMHCLGANEFGEEAKPDTTKARAINGVRAFPDHCYNCVHDTLNGEIDMDCGGPCAPCADAPRTMVIDKSVLKNQNWYTASEKLSTTGEITLAKRKGGIPYELIAGEEIVLNNGFSITNGVEFSAQVDPNPTKFVRQFTHTCEYLDIDVFTPNGDGVNDVWRVKLVGYTWMALEISDGFNSKYYTKEQTIDRDGWIVMWDGTNNKGKAAPSNQYIWYMKLKDYQGNYHYPRGYISIFR